MNGSARPSAADPTVPRAPARPARIAPATALWVSGLIGAWASALAAPLPLAAPAEDVPAVVAPESAAVAAPDSSARATTGVHSIGATEGQRIGDIRILNHNIFEPLPEGRLRGLYKTANLLHLKTRERTVRELLVFEKGEPWQEWQARETERTLRELDYLYPGRIDARRSGDSVLVTVVTRDVWSTAVEFNLESIDGKQYGALGITERNVLGLGKSVEFVYREDPNGFSRTFGAYDPGVFGTRWRFRYSAANGTADSHDLLSLGVPFYSEETRHSYGASWTRNRAVTRLYQNEDEVGQIAHRRNAAEVYWGLGNRTSGRVDRLTFSFLAQDRQIGETRVPPGADIPPELLGGPDTVDLRRFSAESRWWRPRFVERINVDRIGAVEDVDLGPSLAVTGGYSFEALGGSANEGYAKALLDLGAETGFGYATLRATASSRFRDEPEEVIAQVDGRWVHQGLRHQTQVLAARGILGTKVGRDFQVVVGGLNGLRAYPVHAVAGRRVWRLNAENRWLFAEDFYGNAKLGAVVFTDAARAWGAGSGPSRWYVDAGIGFRMALPRWSPERVLRIDVAWPIDPPREGGHQPVLTFGSSQAF